MKELINCCGASKEGANAERDFQFQDKFVVPNGYVCQFYFSFTKNQKSVNV